MQIYVDGNAVRSGNGQKEYPFRTISEAAKIARPGDEVLVAPGVYREYVDPANAGCEDARIVYRSVEPGKAVITGAEIVDNWEHLEGDVWTARVSNGLFGDYNPYTTLVSGDWFIASYTAHTGEVYLNGKSMYEVTSLDQVKKPEIYKKSWDQAFTVYTWYVEQDEEKNETVFYVNFQGKNPNEETVEIMCARIAFIHEGGHRLYHAVRLCCKTGGNPVGSADGISGRNGRPALVKGMDHRGL